MAKKLGMIEIITNFYAGASPDSAEMITRHAIKCNKQVQSDNGKASTNQRVAKPRPAKGPVAVNGAETESTKIQ